MFALFTVFVIIILQTYHFIGHELMAECKSKFEKREKLRESITSLILRVKQNIIKSQHLQKNNFSIDEKRIFTILENDIEYQLLKQKEDVVDQEFDADRVMLINWKNITLGYNFYSYHPKKSIDVVELEKKLVMLENMIKDTENKLKNTSVIQVRDSLNFAIKSTKINGGNIKDEIAIKIDRQEYFEDLSATEFVLSLLHDHILPLLYGLLGALVLVLRSLEKTIRLHTFIKGLSLGYNIRIILGTIGGMAVGLFFGTGDENSLFGTGFSLMLLAFIIGYKIEILFSLMDMVADKIKFTKNDVRKKNAAITQNAEKTG